MTQEMRLSTTMLSKILPNDKSIISLHAFFLSLFSNSKMDTDKCCNIGVAAEAALGPVGEYVENYTVNNGTWFLGTCCP